MSSRGSLSNLRPVPQAVRPQPGPGQVRNSRAGDGQKVTFEYLNKG